MSETERQRESRREGEAIGTEQGLWEAASCLGQLAVGCLAATVGLLVLVGGALLFAACDPGESAEPGHIVQWSGPTYPIPDSPHLYSAVEFDGPDHCGWEKARFLQVPAADISGREGATQELQRRPALTFVRDPRGVIRSNVVGELNLHANLPADAVKAPYTQKRRELWFSPSESASGAYLVEGSKVERWPRFDGGCD